MLNIIALNIISINTQTGIECVVKAYLNLELTGGEEVPLVDAPLAVEGSMRLSGTAVDVDVVGSLTFDGTAVEVDPTVAVSVETMLFSFWKIVSGFWVRLKGCVSSVS